MTFRADATQYKPDSYPEGSDFLGADINRDITIPVDSSREDFTISVFEACDLSIYAYFELDVSLSRADPNSPGDRITLATTNARFSMSRYLEQGVPTATPPIPGAAAWMEPDPTMLDWTVHDDWQQFRFRADISRYIDHHLGVVDASDVEGLLYAPGANIPSLTVKEACEQAGGDQVDWRRAINQPLAIGLCKEGQATIQLRPYNDEIHMLAEISFPVVEADPHPLPPPPPPPPPSPTPTPRPQSQSQTSTTSSGGGGGGFGPAPVAPSFRDGFRATREVAENTLPSAPVGNPIAATHPDELAIEYSLSGADRALFTVDAENGQIRVGQGTILDFEKGRNAYTVNVTATDTAGFGALITVAIRVLDVDLGPYDLDDDGKITRVEVLAAVRDYFKQLIGKDMVIQLIRLYFAG